MQSCDGEPPAPDVSEMVTLSVVAAVERDLKRLRKLDPALADSTVAASALMLAAELDDPENSATSKSMCARELREAMDRLRELAPVKQESTPIDELRKARSKRRARASAS